MKILKIRKISIKLIIALSLILVPNILVNQKNSNFPIEKRTLNETTNNPIPSLLPSYDVCVSGDYAYIATSGGLSIINISDPTNPGSPINRNTNGYANGVFVSGDYAYVADGGAGLAVIDISDPTNPGAPVYRNTNGDSWGVYVSGDYAYVADGSTGLAIIDISDPTSPGAPVYRNTGGFSYDVFVSGDFAYIADSQSGLAVVNISDPTSPRPPIYENTIGYAFDVFVSGDYAYVADDYGLAVIDISNPTNPSYPIYRYTSGNAFGVYVSGDYAYVADYDSGLAVIDISDPTDPGFPIYRNANEGTFGVYVDGDYAYVADYYGLTVIEISEPIVPEIIVYRDTTGNAFGVYVSGDYAYVADYESGLAIIDISDPTNPGIPFYEDTSGGARDVCISGDYAYVADYESGLAIIDISDPTNPGAPIYRTTTGYTWGVDVSGDYAFVACGSAGLAVIDISDPTNPGPPIYEDTYSSAMDVYVSGDYAYVADYDSGLAVINISDPTNPGTPIYEDTEAYVRGLDVSGDYAFVACGSAGLAVIDISDPTNPGTPIYEGTTSGSLDVYVSGDNAYVADGNPGFAVVNISCPFNPGPTVFEDPGIAIDVYVSGEYAYIAAGRAGLAVIKIREMYDSADPIIINAPSDFSVDLSYSGINISWTATDLNPDTYIIELQGTGVVEGPLSWSNGAAVTYDVPDGFSIGDYIYTITFTDDNGNSAIDSVTISVEDMIVPKIIAAPNNFSVEFGYSGVNISWTAIDVNPNTYTIELQGTGIVAGPLTWINGTPITYNIPDGFNVGEYIYTIHISDDYDHFVTHTVSINIEDTKDPIIIDTPSDFTLDYGYSGVSISWTATDPHPHIFIIELQGSGIIAGPTLWLNGTPITYNILNGLSIGQYVFTVNITDDYNNFATHTVIMNVGDSVEDVLELEIVSQSFSTEEFNITFFIHNKTGYGIDFATFQIWWNGIDVSANVQNLGNGFYFVSLVPITVAPGEDPILLSMFISADGYEDKSFETYIAVDPATLEKETGGGGEEFPLIVIIAISSTVGAIGITAIAVGIWRRRRLPKEAK